MALHAAGAAFVDRSGAVLAADATFLARLGVGEGDPSAALRARAEASPALRALLAGDGPAVATVPGVDGPIDVERVAAGGGLLLVLRDPLADERVEHALRSQVLGRVVAGVTHDIKNPLNAMSLQLALLGDKLGAGDANHAAAGHLGALRDQIGRVNDVLRRLSDALDPPAPLGYTDIGALVTDIASLLAYEARRRRVDLVIDAHPGGARTPGDPARVGRLVLALLGRALARTPDGGRFAARAATRGGLAIVDVEHAAGDPDGDLGYEVEVLAAGAAALGGQFERAQVEKGTERLTLAMPGNERE
ncbi:MAG TPA: histidine kinase dimerization/phospho-acceptor domain-containing protein [Anaeromyxobacter sp.]